MSFTPSNFAFAVCTPGSEPLLKRELQINAPSLRLAFSKPGFVTFKSSAPLEIGASLPSVFARVSGVSFGRAEDRSAVAAFVKHLASHTGRAPAIAVFARSAGSFSEISAEASSAVARWKSELAGIEGAKPEAIAAGDLVLDIAVDPAEGAWMGVHLQPKGRAAFEGGLVPVELHPEAPSRAYLKLEEAVRLFQLPLRKGERALELGSAPGGASLALLERGLAVTGVDPGEMAPNVLSKPGFIHQRIPAGALKRSELPKPLHWIVLDMNLAPPVSLRYLERCVGPSKSTLRGCVLTLKLNEASMVAEIPSYLAKVTAMGFRDVRATHLPSNGQEICVVGKIRD
ncbi:MAG: hypothetical protein HOW73_24345 [Polyangiaceae bacterium]|nr:hypothetical protein [Polyangiaceae bacterium]